MPSDSRSSNSPKTTALISPNAGMLDELRPLLGSQMPDLSITHVKGYPSPRDFATALGGSNGGLVFLDAASDREQSLQLLAEITRSGKGIHVIALLGGNEPDFILRCLRAGATDFLLRPFSAEQVEEVLAKISRLQATDIGKEPAKVIAVTPAKGACGATTVACNLAFHLKRLGAQKVLLADLDPLAGTLSFLLKIKSVYSFQDALQRAHELDIDLWKAMVTNVNGVDVMLAPEILSDSAPELRDPSPILDFARNHYDVVILDTGSVYGDWNLNQTRLANEILLVTTNELPALQAAQRALSYLDSNRVGRWKVRLVVNRYHRDIGLNKDVIGTALHSEVFETLPSDYDAIQKSLMEGKPVPGNTPLGKAFAQLADRFAGGKSAQPKKPTQSSSIGSLLGLFSKTSK